MGACSRLQLLRDQRSAASRRRRQSGGGMKLAWQPALLCPASQTGAPGHAEAQLLVQRVRAGGRAGVEQQRARGDAGGGARA